MDNYYQILGVSQNAELAAIKKSYRKLALKYHPDRNPNDPSAEDKFNKITEAYEILGSKEKRSAYDRKLNQKTNFHQQSSRQQRTKKRSANVGDFEKKFEQFFGFNPKTKERVKSKGDQNKGMDTDNLFNSFFGVKK
mgnify:CR=1 FL=1